MAASGAELDAAVVGAGPNGLAGAIAIAQHGLDVRVYESCETIGGGARTLQLTEPGFWHDTCSAVHPMAVASPFFKMLPLREHGLAWIDPPIALAHPLHDGTAVTLRRSIDATAATLDEVDASAYQSLMRALVVRAEPLIEAISKPLPPTSHPWVLARFMTYGLRGITGLARTLFRGERARALMAGLGGHALLPLHRPAAGVIGLYLAVLAHHVGWPIPRGGAQKLSDALAEHLQSLGGRIETERLVRSLNDLPSARANLLEVMPRQMAAIAAARLPTGYRRRLRRYRHGPGVFKIDWALDGPIPWRADGCGHAGTVHLGGSFEEIAAGEQAVADGEHPQRPFVLLTQPTLFDPSRAPAGKHVAWAYCHVPSGSGRDMTELIERQVERFAPGFREMVRSRSVMNAQQMEAHNRNYIGGDINGGASDLWQMLFRPVMNFQPWATPNRGIYLCSAATPPGGGIHGMCGYNAAQVALRRLGEA